MTHVTFREVAALAIVACLILLAMYLLSTGILDAGSVELARHRGA